MTRTVPSLSTRVALVFAVSATMLLASPAAAAVLTVSQWGVGYPNINAAIDDAYDGDIIEVELGIYNEDVNFDGKNVTVISTSGPEVTTILGNSTAVTFTSGENSGAVLDGFTVTSNGSYGLNIQGSAPVIRSCTIEDVSGYSAYIYNYAEPTFEECTFQNNSGSYPLYIYYYAEPTFTDCTFRDNTATHGGAMYIDAYSDVTIDNGTFVDNTASNWGGAIYGYYSGLTLHNSTFERNQGYYGTLALYSMSFGEVDVRDNLFFLNEAEYGGALYAYDSHGYIADNRLVENRAQTNGGGVYLDSSNRLALFNNTIVGSVAYGYGSGIYAYSSNNVVVANNIIAHSSNGEGIYTNAASTRLQFVHNDVYDHGDGDYGGTMPDQTGKHGNLSVDPGFVAYSRNQDLSDDDLSLDAGSPLIDGGAPDLPDLDGTVSDIGWNGGDDLAPDPGGFDYVVSKLGNGDFTTITDALAVAGHGDRILLYPGMYYENVDTDGLDVEIVSLAGPEVTALVGSSTAIYIGNGEAPLIQGLTLWSPGSHAAYVYNYSAPEFVDCWFRLNSSYALYNHYYTDASFTGCLFEDNAGSYPNYHYLYAGSRFDGCTFRDNSATHGGAIYFDSYSDAVVEDSMFDGNYASNWGGAIYAYASQLDLRNSTFVDNAGYYGTVAMYAMDTPSVIDDCNFLGNIAEYGGGIYVYHSMAHLTHNEINGNAATYGGGIYLDTYAHVLIANNTLVDNDASTTGGGIYAAYYDGAAVINNVIAYSADGEGIYSDYTEQTGRMYLAHNDVYGNYDGEYGGALVDPTGERGNLSVPPSFVGFSDDDDPTNDDLHLAGDSLLIDAGSLDYPDPDGSRSDIGLYGGDLVGDTTGADIVVSQTGDGDTRLIADAMAMAGTHDVILVQPGVYWETVDYAGVDATVRGTLGPDVTYIGGYSGGVNWDNGEGPDAVLEDLSVWTSSTYGLYIYSSSPTIRGCRMLYASSYSTYIYYYADPLFEDCEFFRNSGSYPQYVYHTVAPTFRRCSFVDNYASSHGGGLYVDSYSDVTVEECAFIGNTSASWGGALYVYNSEIDVADTTFAYNTGTYGTVALNTVTGDDYFYRNSFCGNYAEYGGAVYLSSTTSAFFGQNIFQDNEANTYGGAIYAYYSDPSIVNNTFVDNTSTPNGGGHVYLDGATTVSSTNNIFAYAQDGDGMWIGPSVSYNIYYSDFWDNTATHLDGQITTLPATNLEVDPLFVGYYRDGDCANDDLRLAEGSPLIDAGHPSLTDPDGSPSDIGAYGGGGPPNPDYDHDGYGPLDGDCDNLDPDTYPGAPEIQDGIDNDCDGEIDEGTFAADDDGDGYSEADGDCDDADPTVYPGATEVCDGVDNNCDGAVDEGVLVTFYRDADGDAWGDSADSLEDCQSPPGYVGVGGDCDDNAPLVNPGASEDCNGIDDDCNGQVDDTLTFEYFFPDGDGDGFGDPQMTPVYACEAPQGYVADATDCDDADAAINPGMTEQPCDGVDNDCDGALHVHETDDDGDGVTECDGDCDDADAAINPAAAEVCDGLDNNCDGAIDEGQALVDYYPDADGDGWGDANAPVVQACQAPPDHVQDRTDCDDGDAAINPGMAEVPCDGVDNDCDGALHGDDSDDDGDGYSECDGDCDDTDAALTPVDGDGDGFSTCSGDCDDGDAAVNPGLAEVCDGLDTNCDGVTPADEVDADGDGWLLCDNDCDDADATVWPGAPELCDNVDNDCDGVVDEDVNVDADGDGYTACDGDCDDGDADTYPGATELCDGADNDCDGVLPADEQDADGDGWSTCDGDCEDADAAIHPDAVEICNGVDDDCDPATDENVDDDGDGASECAGDCDDADADSYPGALELCDGIDNDCDGIVPADEFDDDGDGWLVCENDCDDADADTYPGAPELCDQIDNNCNGAVDEGVEVDNDQDGYDECAGDCNDADSTIYPGAQELCDGIDNDCNGVLPPVERDLDNDGWMICDGDCNDLDATLNLDDVDADGATTCDGDCDDLDPTLNLDDVDGDGFDTCDGDCDDAEADTFPGAAEQCDGEDNDCDGVVPADEDDDDGDGWAGCDGDCDDGDAGVNPGVAEDCFDGVDNDCDGLIDLNDDDCGGDDDDTTDDDDDTTDDDDDTTDDDDDDTTDDDDDDTTTTDDDDDTTTTDDDDDTTDDIPGDDDTTGDDDDDTTGDCECSADSGARPTLGWLLAIGLVGLIVRRRR